MRHPLRGLIIRCQRSSKRSWHHGSPSRNFLRAVNHHCFSRFQSILNNSQLAYYSPLFFNLRLEHSLRNH